MKTLRRAYECFELPKEAPPLECAALEQFLLLNGIDEKMLVRIEGASSDVFFTVIRSPDSIKFQYYEREGKVNQILYVLDVTYPNISREECEPPFFSDSSHSTIIYGFLHALDRYSSRWILDGS